MSGAAASGAVACPGLDITNAGVVRRMDRAQAGSRTLMTVNPVQLQKYLGGIDYPADKRQLIDRARENGADDNVIETLSSLDRDRFNSPNDVSEALGGRR